MKFRCEIEVSLPSVEDLLALHDSIKVEAFSYGKQGYRSKVEITEVENNSFKVVIESNDLSSFRAAINSFLRLIGPTYTLAVKGRKISTNG